MTPIQPKDLETLIKNSKVLSESRRAELLAVAGSIPDDQKEKLWELLSREGKVAERVDIKYRSEEQKLQEEYLSAIHEFPKKTLRKAFATMEKTESESEKGEMEELLAEATVVNETKEPTMETVPEPRVPAGPVSAPLPVQKKKNIVPMVVLAVFAVGVLITIFYYFFHQPA